LVKAAATMRMPSSRRRRQVAVFASYAADDADGADARGALAGRLEDLAGERRHRCLAAGSGDGDEHFRLARVEPGRHQRQRAARVVGPDDRDAATHLERRRAAGEDRDRAAAHRVGGEAGAVGCRARQRSEEIAAVDSAAVGGEAGDVDGPGAFRQRQVGGGEVPKEHSLSVSVVRVTPQDPSF
jgi:hypothetical protein